MPIALAILSVILGLATLLLAVVVPVSVVLANRSLVIRDEDRHVSGVALLGSVVGFLAIVLVPIGTVGDRLVWSWVPLAVEATVFGLGLAYWNLSGLRNRDERQRGSRQR